MMDIIGPLKAQIREAQLWNQLLWFAFILALIIGAVLGYMLKVEKNYSAYLAEALEEKRAKKDPTPPPPPKQEPSPTAKWLDEATTAVEKSDLRVDLNIFDLRKILILLISKQLIKP